jgi:hypothetical protein
LRESEEVGREERREGEGEGVEKEGERLRLTR